MEKRLSFPGKISRLRERLRNPEWRKYGKILLMGKITGVGLILLAAVLMNPDLLGLRTFAADPVLKGNDIVNPIKHRLDAARGLPGISVCRWASPCSKLGFLPLARNRERVDGMRGGYLSLRSLVLTAWGSRSCSHGNGFIGLNWFFLQGAPAHLWKLPA